MKLKLFWRKECKKCQPAKIACKYLEENGFEVEYYDIDTVDGMAEAAFYGVVSTPTAIVVDERGNEIVSWRGEAPDTKVIMDLKGKD